LVSLIEMGDFVFLGEFYGELKIDWGKEYGCC
jgi:hypothetical protein